MAFSGFTAEATAFLEGLARQNDREWFNAHREQYDEHVRAPLEALLADAESRYGPGRVMRPNRDVRFSPNKAPYRLDASMMAGRVGGVYLRLSRSGLDVGGGLYEPSRDQLRRGRDAIAHRPTAADALRTAVDTLERQGFELAGPALKTAPRGYDRDHPAVELLRMQHYAASTRLPLDASADRIRTAWRRSEPLLQWIEEYVGPAQEPVRR